MKKIIALTGEKLSGKGTAAAYLENQHGAHVLRFSAPLSDILARLHMKNTRDYLVRLASHLRNAFGEDILVKTVRHDIDASSSSVIVVDGLRYEVELEQLKSGGDFKLVYITAPVEERFKRAQGRTEKADEAEMSYEEFLAREHDTTEQGITTLKSKADVTIVNDGSFEQLYEQLDSLV